MPEHPDRLIDWTGERCVPWTADIQVIYEHYHRYVFASRLVEGRRVLDLACGEGYGSALLATRASDVVGIDIDELAVRHAFSNYRLPNLEFRVGDMTALPALNLGRFDAIVCFEALEHVQDHGAVLAGIANLLADDGLLVISMPDRDVYSDQEGQRNPFHKHELNLAEFQTLLNTWFPHAAILGQSVATGSAMFPRRSGEHWAEGRIFAIEHREGRWEECTPGDPTYLIAVASRSPLPPIPAPTTLLDPRHEIAAAAHGRDPASINRLERLCDDLLLERRRIKTSLDLITRRHDRLFDELAAERSASPPELDETSIVLGLARRYRALVERVAPVGSWRRRLYSRSLYGVKAALSSRSAEAPVLTPVVVFPPPGEQIDVSIVIPVYDGWPITVACLKALERDTCAARFEVIIVDDASSDETSDRLATVANVRVIRLDRNEGFLNACNTGIAAARGRYVVLLNNDTEVTPGWLDALLDIADKDPTVGMVGAKLVYPDGRLQEAGAVVFSDGTGYNYGRGDDPNRATYSFPRDVDYCSGACILVRRHLLEQLGGLDVRFTPAYYEDTDLAFSIRELGYRVVYQPKAVVVHHEGATNGTDITSGVKQYQEVNLARFRDKWASQLSLQQTPSLTSVRAGSWRGSRPRVLVTDYKVPTPDQDSGSRRMFGILKLLAAQGYRVSFLPANRFLAQPYTADLESLGVEVLDSAEDIPAFIASISSQLDLAVLSRPAVAWPLVPTLMTASPRTRVIYDTVDLHYVRERRRAEIENDITVARLAEQTRQMELTLAAGADMTWVVTETEREILASEVPKANISVVPNIHDDESSGLPFEMREGILFVGSFPHHPNRDAAHYLVEKILPLVWQKIPNAQCYLVGSSPTPDILELEQQNVHVLGWVPDLRELYERVRVFVAPLRYGAGMKGKIGESLAHGVPVVTTTIGAEGMMLEPHHEALVADDTAELAKAVMDTYSSKEVWTHLAINGRRAVAERFSPAVVGETLEDLLVHVLTDDRITG